MLSDIVAFITTIGNSGAIWIALSVVLLIIKKTRWIGMTMAVALVIDGIAINWIFKPLFARPRPFMAIEGINLLVKMPHSFSFPSGHTSTSFSAAMTFLFMNKKSKWASVLIALAILIALSRIYLCLHYPSDVIVSMIFGILNAWMVSRIFKSKRILE